MPSKAGGGFKFRGDDLSEMDAPRVRAFDLYALYLFIEPFIKPPKTGSVLTRVYKNIMYHKMGLTSFSFFNL